MPGQGGPEQMFTAGRKESALLNGKVTLYPLFFSHSVNNIVI